MFLQDFIRTPSPPPINIDMEISIKKCDTQPIKTKTAGKATPDECYSFANGVYF